MLGRRGVHQSAELPSWGVVVLLLGTALSLLATSAAEARTAPGEDFLKGTIVFSTKGRSHFAFDVFGIKLPVSWGSNSTSVLQADQLDELRLTDGVSINYNGHLVEGKAKPSVLERLRSQGVNVADESNVLAFVSDRDGSSRIYYTTFSDQTQSAGGKSETVLKAVVAGHPSSRRETLQKATSLANGLVLDAGLKPDDGPFLFDRPIVVCDSILYVSTKEPHRVPRESWTALYKTDIKTQATTRLTPEGHADFSPAVSPDGKWVAVASAGTAFHSERGELKSNVYVFKVEDGSSRKICVKHAGWPSWANEHTLFFHRLCDDGWWSIFRVTLKVKGSLDPDLLTGPGAGIVSLDRVTPPGVHAITPAASRTGNWVAVAIRRPGSKYRQIEIFSLITNSFIKLTEHISPNKHHYNPFISASTGFVGYHRCRGNDDGTYAVIPLLQGIRSPTAGLSLVTVDGTFPAFNPDGSLLAFAREVEGPSQEGAGIFVSNADGSNQKKVYSGTAFAPAWDPKRKGVLYASVGQVFGDWSDPAQIIAIHNAHKALEDVVTKYLTKKSNNAYPSPSPDGKHLVFRSTRSGQKNLWIMDAEEGEEKELRQLTEGPGTDQLPNWSPSGVWIAFASNRERLSTGKIAIFLIRPNGTGLHKVIDSDHRKDHSGTAIHPIFSPDSKKLVFVSDLAGNSVEEVSVPHLYMPFGQLFVSDVDGSNIKRLTHNTFEDGTPTWIPNVLLTSDLSSEGRVLDCDVEDFQFPTN